MTAHRRHRSASSDGLSKTEPQRLDPDEPGDLALRDGWTRARHREWDDAFRRAFLAAGGRYRDDEQAVREARLSSKAS